MDKLEVMAPFMQEADRGGSVRALAFAVAILLSDRQGRVSSKYREILNAIKSNPNSDELYITVEPFLSSSSSNQRNTWEGWRTAGPSIKKRRWTVDELEKVIQLVTDLPKDSSGRIVLGTLKRKIVSG
jgi:hypothetical protein